MLYSLGPILVAMKPLMDHLAEMGAGPAFGGWIGGGVSYIIRGSVLFAAQAIYARYVPSVLFEEA